MYDVLHSMVTSIRNIDQRALRRLEGEASRKGITIGEAMTEAIRYYMRAPPRKFDISQLPVPNFGPRNEHISEEIDKVLYGPTARWCKSICGCGKPA